MTVRVTCSGCGKTLGVPQGEPGKKFRLGKFDASETHGFDKPDAVRANPAVQEAYLGSVLADQQAAEAAKA